MNGGKITGYESVRLSNASLLTPSDSIESHKAYANFVSSLKSPIARKAYVIRLKYFDTKALKEPVYEIPALLVQNVRGICELKS